jgi:hypothetical protein
VESKDYNLVYLSKDYNLVYLNKDEGIAQLHKAMQEFRADRPLRFTKIAFSNDWLPLVPDDTAEGYVPGSSGSLFIDDLICCLDLNYNKEDNPIGSFGYLFGMVVYFQPLDVEPKYELPPFSCLVSLGG